MITKDITQELQSILEQLHQQGKEPSVALVKSRLSIPVPMPAIITTIKMWKSNRQVPKVEVNAATSAMDKVAQLEQQVILLTQRIDALEAKLEEK
jgi:uncharacterized protein YlxW (UPF0749 family)